MTETPKYLPNIPIKITRRDDRIRFKCGDMQIELQELNEGSQYYPLLVLDKFITEVTTVMLKKEINAQRQREAVKKALGTDDDTAADNVVRQIHEDLFGQS